MVEPRKGFKFHNADCMDIMKDYPDKYFDLAVVDPEYGIGVNHNMGRRKGIHPTQKPKALYKWIYDNYAKEGQKIIDTHLGSNSNGIAAYFSKMGEFVGIEKDPDYFKDGVNRFIRETSDMYNPQEVEFI